MNSKISDKDKKDWENFVSNKDRLPNKDFKQYKKTSSFQIKCDLHGYSLDTANDKIRELINHAYNNGIRKILIITGKGLHSDNERNPYISKNFGILKNSVPNYIKSNLDLMELVKEIREADVNDGGSGAFYIFLKKKTIK